MSLIPKKHQWQKWPLPSKLTAIGTLLTIISISFFLFEKGYNFLGWFENRKIVEKTLPNIAFKFFNHTDSLVSVASRGDFILWLPQGLSFNAPNIPGKFKLFYPDKKDSIINKINVSSHDSVFVFGAILNENYFYRLFERSDCDIDFLLRKSTGGILNTYTIPFSEKYINSGYLPVHIKN